MEVDRRTILQTDEGVGCVIEKCVFSAPPLNGVMPGKMYVQNLPSMMVAHLLEPQEGTSPSLILHGFFIPIYSPPCLLAPKIKHTSEMVFASSVALLYILAELQGSTLHSSSSSEPYPSPRSESDAGPASDPRAGERVLDMCSSPGGKTTHVAALMKGTGEVIALDRTAAKVSIVLRNAQELGLGNVKGSKADSSELLPQLFAQPLPGAKAKKDDPNRTFFEEESFDRIVLDPPCTALGIRPRLKVDLPDAELATAAGYQRKMLHNAIRLLKACAPCGAPSCTARA